MSFGGSLAMIGLGSRIDAELRAAQDMIVGLRERLAELSQTIESARLTLLESVPAASGGADPSPRSDNRGASPPDDEIVTLKEVAGRLRISRQTLHRMRRNSTFPQPLRVSEKSRAVRFSWPAVFHWVSTQNV